MPQGAHAGSLWPPVDSRYGYPAHVLTSPSGKMEMIAALTSGTYARSAFGGESLVGIWTLEITDWFN